MVTRKIYTVVVYGTDKDRKPSCEITYFERQEDQLLFFNIQVQTLEEKIIKDRDVTKKELHAIGYGEKTHPFFGYDISDEQVTYADYCGPETIGIWRNSTELAFREERKIWEV